MAKIVFAGGGTAGHIEPALAVARVWREKYPADEILFLGTESGLENQLVPTAGFLLKHIRRVSIARHASFSWFAIPAQLARSFAQARSVLVGAQSLIGFGGYVSAPAYLAAKTLGIPIVIHEANAKPGWANRLGAYLTPYLAVAQEVRSGKFSSALQTGLPLRADVSAALENVGQDWQGARRKAKLELGFKVDQPLILVMGGSQGSQTISAVVENSLDVILSAGNQVLHSVGIANSLPTSRSGYQPIHYIENMARALLASDLVIARSGAVTCSEFRALGRYALFVPLAIGNGEQELNALNLVCDGRAEVIRQKDFIAPFITENIARLVKRALSQPLQGSSVDLLAAQKIASLAEFAMAQAR